VPRVFVPADRLTGAQVALEGEAYKHLVRVLRLGAGDEVVLFDGRGTEIEGRLVAVGGRQVTVALGERRPVPPAGAVITLLQGLPRGERMDLIVQKATELGVRRIVPVLAERSVTRPPASRSRRWRVIAEEAARQCGRADVPDVDEPMALPDALGRIAALAARLALWEEERGRPLRAQLSGGPAETALLVGPEGGLAAGEVQVVRAAGFVTVGLGPRILRVETAALVAIALVQAAAGGLD
jgi:16S rRNA (uracil1498-N3)-methyltransferase